VSIEQEAEQLKAAADKATAARHRADAQLAAATERVQQVLGELKAEFKVESLAAAREKEKQMKDALAGETARVRSLLEQAGGQA
jgi:D-ribose pyranose/furanose isomerase RbsD